VLGLRITGGFLAGIELEFADGLNCLIGGRGTGKTTALEFLRFGLGLMPDPKISPQRHRAIEGLVKTNLTGGRLSIELRTKTGLNYTAQRGLSEAVQVINEAGTPVPIALDRDQIFSADVFSQNEIEEIASNPAAQLDLLDRFVDNETTTIARELELLHRLGGRHRRERSCGGGASPPARDRVRTTGSISAASCRRLPRRGQLSDDPADQRHPLPVPST
jgi:DNA repair ATPase RecN